MGEESIIYLLIMEPEQLIIPTVGLIPLPPSLAKAAGMATGPTGQRATIGKTLTVSERGSVIVKPLAMKLPSKQLPSTMQGRNDVIPTRANTMPSRIVTTSKKIPKLHFLQRRCAE